MEKGIMQSLRKAVGSENVSDDPVELMLHSRDSGPMLEEFPVAVVRPGSTQDVSAILKVANEHKICVMPRCAASITYGASVPRRKGMMIIQMDRMNRVLDIDEDAMVVTVEAGCPWSRLERTINPRGWRVGIMPPGAGMLSGVGSSVSVGGVSHWSARYGIQPDNVTGLEVVLPMGMVIKTGSWAMEGVKPFDSHIGTPGEITHLFSRAEGIFGILTKVSLRMYSIPEARTYLLHTFKTLSAIKRMIYRIQKLELAASIFMFGREIVATTGWPVPMEPAVWGGVEGCSQVEVDEKAKIWRRIAEEEGGTEASPDIARSFGEELQKKVHRYTWANEAFFPGGGRFQVLAAMPIPRIEEFLNITEEVAAKHGFNFFGAGYGFAKNVAYMFMVMPYYEREPGQREKSLIAGAEAVEAVIDAGMGLMSKDGLLASRYDRMDKGTFEFMKVIKEAVDPNNIMVAPWE